MSEHVPATGAEAARIDADLLRPLQTPGPAWWATLGLLLSIIGLAAYAWYTQLSQGMGVAGINNPNFWGIYITNYVFWIGISHAGTLISAILRLTHTGWRRPITRCAEAITLFALLIGPPFAIVHLGRAWYFYRVLPFPDGRGLWPNFRSPLIWDMVAITTYMVGSIFYLYLPMIPDLALLRERVKGWRRPLYRLLAAGWRGTECQWRRLEKTVNIMAVVILLVAVSVHTVVSFVFGMSIVPTWHSTIFGPYFVCGAIFSGLGTLLIAMAALRSGLKLQDYLRPLHFDNLAKMLLLMSLLWTYFMACEHLTMWYGNLPEERAILEAKVSGAFAPLFWTMVTCNFLIPVLLLAWRKVRTSPWLLAGIGLLIDVGMYLERYLIIVPALERPRLALSWGSYSGTWVEATITLGTFAVFAMLYMLFSRIFPVVAIWEYKLGEAP